MTFTRKSRFQIFAPVITLGVTLLGSSFVNPSANAATCAPDPAGLVGWWPGEGNANDIIGTNNGVLVNGTGFAPGIVGQAFSFNGTNNYVTNAVPGLTNITNSYTMEFWAWPTAGRVSTTEVNNGINGTSGQRYAIFPNSGRYTGYVGAGVSVGTNGVSVFEQGGAYMPSLLVYDTPLSNWTHVAVVYSNQQPFLYLNSALVRTGLVSTRASYPSTDLGESGQGYGYYAGLLDEVSIYSRPLSGAEILSIYNAGSAGKCGPPSPPVITVQPTNQTVLVGGTAMFTVTVTGATPLSYQWTFNATNLLAGATNALLTLTNVQLAQAGNYTVQVTNALGSTLSSNAVLTVSPPQPPCASPPTGLISWWPAEGSGADIAGTNNGALVGNINFVPGEVGVGISLDGVHSGISVPDSPDLNFGPGADFSVEAWVQPLVAATDYGVMDIVDKRIAPTSTTAIGYEVYLGYGKLGFEISDTLATSWLIAGPTGPDLRDGAWHHVAVTVQRLSTTGGQLYVDGKPIYTFDPTSKQGDLTTTQPLLIGLHPDYPTVNANFKGVIDEVSLYKRALSAAEIQAIFIAGSGGKCKAPAAPFIFLQPTNQTVRVGGTATFAVLAGGTPPLSYQWTSNGASIAGATNTSLVLTNVQFSQAGYYAVQVTNLLGAATSSNATLTVTAVPPCATPPAGLISWWRAENDTADQVGGNSGTVVGNATFGPGQVGQAFAFDGNADAVQVGNPASLQLQDFTIEAWIKRASASTISYNGPLGMIFAYGAGGYGLYLDSNGNPALSKITYNNVTLGTGITDTNYHHLAVTKTGSSVVFYIDGVAYPAPAYNPGFVFSTGAEIGAWGSSLASTFFGSIDELAIYNRALSSNEIQAIYNADGAGKCVVPIAPFFVTQPANQTVTAGGNATFTSVGGGSVPLTYQWSFNGAAITGATGNSLTLASVQISQAGNYSVTVTNAAGSATSTNAFLTVNFPPAPVQLPNTNAASGGIVTLPVVLVANGNENALGFSLNFDSTRLTYTGATLGSGAPGAVLMSNASQINSGRLGLAVALPPGATFSPGAQQVVQVSFVAAVLSFSTSTLITFGDQPTPRQLLDTQLNTLAATYYSGSVLISAATAFEGDVFPRPNGDKSATLSDWLLMGRYAARLDYPTNAPEFQRADCAPRATLGDGAIKVTDWVQVGRYASGLEPLTPVGGPTNEIAGPGAGPSASRLVTVGGTMLIQGRTGTVGVTLAAQGNENALGFSLAFDPTLVSFAGASLGSAASGATLYVNTNQAASGRLGFALALGTGSSFAPGTREVVEVSFLASLSGSGSFTPSFGDQPVPREVSDAAASALPASYVNSTITINPPPSLQILLSGQNITLAWPLWGTNFVLQQASGAFSPSMTWSNLTVTPAISNDQSVVTLPLSGAAGFYRLYHP